MTSYVMDHLNKSIAQVEKNFHEALNLDFGIRSLRLKIFQKNTRNFAESNERLWDRITNARKSKEQKSHY